MQCLCIFNPHFRGHSNGKFGSVHSPDQGAGQTMGQACNHAFNDRNQFFGGKIARFGTVSKVQLQKTCGGDNSELENS